MAEKITAKQKRVYDLLKKHIREKGYPPSVREICDALGLKSTSSVHAHLEALENKGYIRRSKAKNRSIEVLEDDFYYSAVDYVNLPIVDEMKTGPAAASSGNAKGYFPVPVDYIGNHEAYMLCVKDDSMNGKGLVGNDLALVRRTNTAMTGEIVVAQAEGREVVRSFYMDRNKIRLQPENPAYEPIVSRDAEILGVVIGLFRRF